ncbi:MAG: phage tail tube protein [Hyphomonas sp.]|jgi:hypothetical protein|nr:phage tail tube protein [Hyphomonas sp.]
MSSANRVRIGIVREITPGVTPPSPRLRALRYTGESLQFSPEYIDSDEIRDDRMMGDPILTMQSSGGGINFELSYPEDESPLSEIFRSAFFNSWVNTPQRFNDGTADSVITDVAATGVITVTAGPAFAIGHLIRTTGFGVAQNNGLFRVTTGSATVPSVGTGALATEAAPLGTARVKVVGFEGAAGDIAATASGLSSTALNFTTLGLAVGQSIKIGGTATINRFATAANNGFARITAITANALTLDNLPAGWAPDVGTGRSIRVWIGDQIRNGTAETSLTIERGFMGQAVPTYIVNTGMRVNTMQITAQSRQKISGNANFMGMGGSTGTVSLDAALDPATTAPVMGTNSAFQRLSEGGSVVTGPNWIRSVEFTINNNLRMIENVSSLSPVDVQPGECTVTGRGEFYFGDNAILQKFYNGTPTSIFMASVRANRGIVFQFPRVTYRGGSNPSVSAKNTDVTMNLDWQASFDPLTSAHAIAERFEYIE